MEAYSARGRSPADGAVRQDLGFMSSRETYHVHCDCLRPLRISAIAFSCVPSCACTKRRRSRASLGLAAAEARIPTNQATVGQYLHYLADALLVREFRRHPLGKTRMARVPAKLTLTDLAGLRLFETRHRPPLSVVVTRERREWDATARRLFVPLETFLLAS